MWDPTYEPLQMHNQIGLQGGGQWAVQSMEKRMKVTGRQLPKKTTNKGNGRQGNEQKIRYINRYLRQDQQKIDTLVALEENKYI